MPLYNFIIDFGNAHSYKSRQIVVDADYNSQIKRKEKVPLVVYTLILSSFTTMNLTTRLRVIVNTLHLTIPKKLWQIN